MPKGYVIFTTAIHDKARYDRYVGKAVPTILQYGGRALVAYDGPEVMEGRWYGSAHRGAGVRFDGGGTGMVPLSRIPGRGG
jgi:uncharacterized protein (DUF1330 family)